MFNKLFSIFFIFIACSAIFTASATEPPQLISESGILINADTGQVLFEKDADSKRPPASITKLMTALLVFENAKMDEIVTANHEAVYSVDRGSTHIWLQEGEQLTVENAMYAMLLESANDAANVLAVHVAGSLEEFSKKMNARAKELGCLNTNFLNANGLDIDSHYSSSRDMALIAKALMKYPKFFEIAGALQFRIPATNMNDSRIFNTKHDMLRKNSSQYDSDVIAGKSGWTTNARHTLVTFGRRNGINLIAVVFASTRKNDKFTDTRNLLNYGYENFTPYILKRIDLFNSAVSYYQTDKNGILVNGAPLSDIPVLLKADENKDMLKISFSEPSNPFLTISLKRPSTAIKELIKITINLISTRSENALYKESQTENAPSVLMSFTAPIIVCSIIGMPIIFLYIYRQRRLKRRRRRARELARIKRRRQVEASWDWDI